MIKLKDLLLEEVDEDEMEDLKGMDAILQYLIDHDKEPEVVQLGKDKYVIWDNKITDVDYVNVEDKDRWLYGTNGMRLVRDMIGIIDDRFNKSFWEYPETLYHATPTENVENIKIDGLQAVHKSRGLANRHIRSAVFTSTEPDWITHSYGPSVITINTRAMKRDGFTPYITKEPNHAESDVLNFIAHKIKAWEDDRDLTDARSEGTTDDTRIVYSPIPVKYLSFELV